MTELKPIKEGKVREIYDNGDSLIMVATDRISCFDVILKNQVTKKGTVLTQMSRFWFDMTQDILPNHMILWMFRTCRNSSVRRNLTATACYAVSLRCCPSNASCVATSPEAAGQAM